ncbi:copper amine oxidase N-terminal domain-containing protein [Paenibacillus sp. PK4536]|uniref:copper amine oxidase N-terminal domain-containing protein n=1 Tax=Paenibacillus sp. PK4536 TaxID=3024576 RepID=UPI0023582A30|nr:copper amine oxidase N-terminal domain-containing protein [Paenibacillus sp. PK4536]WIM37640.1 copper amine oxidase N-terminal domain-containing protein [Paenibacillus sp. PK4536]
MKKVYRLIIKGVLVAGLLVQCLPVSRVAYADNKSTISSSKLEAYSLQIDTEGNQQAIQTQAFMQDGLMMVSAADLLNNTGFKVGRPLGWEKRSLVERKESLSTTILNRLIFRDGDHVIEIYINNDIYDFAEEYITMPTTATFKNGRLYIPIDFVASLLNYDVKYDFSKHIINMNSWDNKTEQVNQVKEFVNHYMTGSSEGYSPDLSLYTAAFLEHDEGWIETAFSDEQWPEPHLTVTDWTIKHLFFISHDEVMVKVPYLEMGKVSRKPGAVWLRLIRVNNAWKVDTSTSWNQALYLDDIHDKVNNLKMNEPEKVKEIKKALYASFEVANSKKQAIEGGKAEYKTYPKNVAVLYADDQIAYVYTEYNWSFKQTNENLDKYSISSDEDFITMEKDANGQWKFKTHYGLGLGHHISGSVIRGNYTNHKYEFMSFDDYYLNDPSVKSYISFF